MEMVVVEEDTTIKVDQVEVLLELMELLDKDVSMEDPQIQQQSKVKKEEMVEEEEIGENVEDLRMHLETQAMVEMPLQKMDLIHTELCQRV